MMVDLPVPFSPTRKVTGDLNSMSRERTSGMQNGYSLDGVASGFSRILSKYGGGSSVIPFTIAVIARRASRRQVHSGPKHVVDQDDDFAGEVWSLLGWHGAMPRAMLV
jgi:hypothetical protein